MFKGDNNILFIIHLKKKKASNKKKGNKGQKTGKGASRIFAGRCRREKL